MLKARAFWLACAFVGTAAPVVFRPSSAAAQECACECIDADGEIRPDTCDLDGGGGIIPETCEPLLDDLECCTSPDDENFDPSFSNNGGRACGCVIVAGAAAVSGRAFPGVVPGASGCVDVGSTSVSSPTWQGCDEAGLNACRLGGCTTVTPDAPECPGDSPTPGERVCKPNGAACTGPEGGFHPDQTCCSGWCQVTLPNRGGICRARGAEDEAYEEIARTAESLIEDIQNADQEVADTYNGTVAPVAEEIQDAGEEAYEQALETAGDINRTIAEGREEVEEHLNGGGGCTTGATYCCGAGNIFPPRAAVCVNGSWSDCLPCPGCDLPGGPCWGGL